MERLILMQDEDEADGDGLRVLEKVLREADRGEPAAEEGDDASAEGGNDGHLVDVSFV